MAKVCHGWNEKIRHEKGPAGSAQKTALWADKLLDSAAQGPRRFSRWLLPLLLILLVGVCLLIAEMLLRSFNSLQVRRDRYFSACLFYQYNPEWVRHDPALGFRNRPGKKVRIVRPDKGGFDTEIRTNSQGYRDDEASLRNPRILFLGDSFGFGWGVEQHETCEAVFERLTGLSCLNLAASGYGTLQQYLQLRQYAETHDMRGRVAVFLFYPNDWLEITGAVADVYPVLIPKNKANSARNSPADDLVASTVSREDFDRFIAESHARQLRGLPLHIEILRRFWQARQNHLPRLRKHPFLPEYAPHHAAAPPSRAPDARRHGLHRRCLEPPCQ